MSSIQLSINYWVSNLKKSGLTTSNKIFSGLSSSKLLGEKKVKNEEELKNIFSKFQDRLNKYKKTIPKPKKKTEREKIEELLKKQEEKKERERIKRKEKKRQEKLEKLKSNISSWVNKRIEEGLIHRINGKLVKSTEFKNLNLKDLTNNPTEEIYEKFKQQLKKIKENLKEKAPQLNLEKNINTQNYQLIPGFNGKKTFEGKIRQWRYKKSEEVDSEEFLMKEEGDQTNVDIFSKTIGSKINLISKKLTQEGFNVKKGRFQVGIVYHADLLKWVTLENQYTVLDVTKGKEINMVLYNGKPYEIKKYTADKKRGLIYTKENEEGEDNLFKNFSRFNISINTNVRKISENIKSLFMELDSSVKEAKINEEFNKPKISERIIKQSFNSYGLVGEVSINQNFFDILFIIDSVGGGTINSKKIGQEKFFKTLTINKGDDNNCLLHCLKHLSLDKTKSCDNIRKILNLNKTEYIPLLDIPKIEEYFNMNINIFCDAPPPKNILYKSSLHIERQSVELLLKDNHYSIIQEKYDTISVCYESKEFSKDTKEGKINKDRFEEVFKITKEIKTKDQRDIRYLFWDLETRFNANKGSFLIPYSLSYFTCKSDTDISIEELKEEFDKTINHYFGDDCLERMLNDILNKSYDNKYILVGYNNAKFDNFFLLDLLKKKNLLNENRLFIANGAILQLPFLGHKTFDLYRFTMCSLSNACKSFNTTYKKLEGFDHSFIQRHFNEETEKDFFEQVNNKEKLKEYNNMDVLSLANLFFKVKVTFEELFNDAKAIKKDPKIKFLHLTNHMTLPQMVYAKYQQNKTTKGVFAPINLSEDNFIRKSICAGRVQLFSDKGNPFKVTGGIRCLDVCSLYPFVMMKGVFPWGKRTPVTKEMSEISLQSRGLGIFRCKWIEDKRVNFRPFRSEDTATSLDWHHRGELEGNLTSIEINLMRKSGYKIEVFEGYTWEGISYGEQLFSCLKVFANKKVEQDELKLKEDSKYNAALRECCKLAMNSLSGKFLQRNYLVEEKLITSLDQLETFILRTDDKDKIEYLSVNDNTCYVKGTLKDKFVITKRSKPSQIGVFIYAQARCHMYENILRDYDVLYTDTDSAYFTEKEYQKFIKENPNLMGESIGKFKEELGEGADEAIFIGAKTYFVGYDEKTKNNMKLKAKDKKKDYKDPDKYRLKGINAKDIILDIDNDIKGKSLEDYENKNDIEKFNMYYDKESKRSYCKDLFEKLLVDNEDGSRVTLMCSQLSKSLLENQELIPRIKQEFLIKELVIRFKK